MKVCELSTSLPSSELLTDYDSLSLSLHRGTKRATRAHFWRNERSLINCYLDRRAHGWQYFCVSLCLSSPPLPLPSPFLLPLFSSLLLSSYFPLMLQRWCLESDGPTCPGTVFYMSGIIYALSAAMCFVLFKKFPPPNGSSSELDIAKSGSINQPDEDRVLLDRSSSEVGGEEHHEDEP